MSQDRELDKYLQGKGDLSQLYADAPQVEPPVHLDAAILAEAHRAVHARPGIKPKRRWAIPLGMVASLFAIVMIGLQLPYLLKEPVPLQAPTEASVAAAMNQGAAEQSSRARDDRRKLQAMDKAKSEIAGNKPVPTAIGAIVQPAVPMAAAPVPLVPEPAIAAKRLEIRESAVIENTGALSKEKKSANAGGSNVNDALEQRAPAAALMAAPQSAQTGRALKKDEADEKDLLPEDWLKRIKKLKQDGKQEEATKELAAFKKRYPDFPVPNAAEVR
jgi:hypothetical protein